MKTFYTLALSVLLAFALSGCGTNAEKSSEPVNGAKVGKETSNTSEKAKEEKTQPNSEENNEKNSQEIEKSETNQSTPPSQKDLEVLVEGVKEMRPATLKESDLGYYMYVLKNFSLESEEPNKDVLISQFDGSFFARIEKLGEDANFDEIKKNIMNIYEGNIMDENPKNLTQKEFHNASFYLIAETSDKKDGVKTTVMYVGKEVDGQPYLFTVFLPLKEAAEGLGPNLWAMLASLQNK
ncbi:hypothetical protein [Peribacillus tepidiphilus]|uniref:hypothetical protein n=1 Tax=Peribacillus tepidiphilus TaxID=2652445 RepID=UPI0035B50B34